jgi:hypothetical protein
MVHVASRLEERICEPMRGEVDAKTLDVVMSSLESNFFMLSTRKKSHRSEGCLNL